MGDTFVLPPTGIICTACARKGRRGFQWVARACKKMIPPRMN
nr:MAG TPA: hypothetical protein [Caudoviricetes sp.]DAX69834.1 MAG TPA: hypothetical protein [Caudoviricetes sp.]